MEDVVYLQAAETKRNVLNFYLIIFGIITGFLTIEILIEEYILEFSLGFFEYMIISSILYIGLFVFTLIYASNMNISLTDMGFHGLYVPKALILGFLATIGFLIVALSFKMPLNYTSFFEIFLIFCFTLLIGFTEEAAFRGYIQGSYMKILPQMKAILLTGILFAILHLPSYFISGNFEQAIGLPSLILIGLILGVIRVRTGNLWAVILAHTTWNFYIFLFIPEIDLTTATDIQLISLLSANGAMWGSIILVMLLAKFWVDRPEQIPGELIHAFKLKINKLMARIWKLQHGTSAMPLGGLPPITMLYHYSGQIGEEIKIMEIYKEYLPQITKSTYKIIQQLVPFKIKLIKLKQKIIRYQSYPEKISVWETIKNDVEAQIEDLEIALKGINHSYEY